MNKSHIYEVVKLAEMSKNQILEAKDILNRYRCKDIECSDCPMRVFEKPYIDSCAVLVLGRTLHHFEQMTKKIKEEKINERKE